MEAIGQQRKYDWLLYGILFQFFFQLLSDFIGAIYAFGLLGTDIPPEIVCVLFLFAPALLLFLRRGLPGKGLALIGGLVLVAGVVEVMLDTRGRMLISGIGVGGFLVFFPSLLWKQAQEGEQAGATTLGAGLTLGLALTVLFRVWNSGVDPGGQWWYRVIAWGLAIVASALLLRRLGRAGDGIEPAKPGPAPGFLRVAGLSLGVIAAFGMLYFAFTSPNVIARWTGAGYLPILAVLALALGLFVLAIAFAPGRLTWLTRRIVLAWNVLFVAVLVAAILAHQIGFPARPDGYPLYEPPVTPLHHVPVVLLCALFPVVLVDWILYSRELIALRPGFRALAGGASLASLFFLIVVLAQVFTTVYDYIPVVGPIFRDMFWAVYLVLGLALTLPLLLVRGSRPWDQIAHSKAFAGAMLLIGASALTSALLISSRPVAPAPDKTTLRALTYNIQQGYSADGLQNHVGQLALIRQVDADVIGLQETDTNRIAGGNSDVVRYFADNLHLHSYYGPKVVPGTFGIALLSKYPIENPRTFYMYSAGEQTATIVAEITIGGKRFNVFVTHLGNGGPMVQQEAILEELTGLDDVIAMGDFNFEPTSEQYRTTTAVLNDAWLLKWPRGVDDRGLDPTDRIDHVFLSPGTVVTEARYLTGPQSDHPALVVEIAW